MELYIDVLRPFARLGIARERNDWLVVSHNLGH